MNDDKKSLFIHAVDKEMYLSVLRLEQKLRGLQAEIEAKIEALSFEPDEALVAESRAQLNALSAEVQKVLENIKQLVNLSVEEGMEGDDDLFNSIKFSSEALDEFRQVIQEDIEKISQLKDEF